MADIAEQAYESQEKHLGGRPLLFASVDELQEKIDAYFAECDPHPEQYVEYEYPKKTVKNKDGDDVEVDDYEQEPKPKPFWRISHQKPYLITDLAIFLQTSRETLINYEKREEFFDTIKAAKDKCEAFQEASLAGPHATGPIFNLKNNYGWRDKTEQDLTSGGERLGVTLSAEQADQLIRARANRADS